MNVGFVGGGNMAQAIGGRLLARGVSAGSLCVIEPSPEARAFWTSRGVRAFAGFDPAMQDTRVLVLAVKPQTMEQALASFRAKLTDQLVLSIAAGVRVRDIGLWLSNTALPYANVVRSMPNTPALAGAGISGLFASTEVSQADRQLAEDLLSSVGKCAWFADESMLDAVTAVSGSGPAYVFYFIEALEEAALEMGFDAATARLFATETFLGGAKLAADSADAPATLRARVTSKGGTTERAIASFDRGGLKARFIEGVRAARDRAQELGDGAPATTEKTPK
jgi:pyrroline-5-carboxylate reductase